MKEGDDYCGFLCEEWTQKQQDIIDEVANLREHNPEFAEEFSNKLMNMLLMTTRSYEE